MDKGLLQDKSVLVTGGTGSFGRYFLRKMLDGSNAAKLICFSRDELKQHDMQQASLPSDQERLRFFIGDIRDRDRLRMAMRGVDIVIHAAALKQVPALEYNPAEAIKTNILGSQNIIEMAIDAGVHHVVALSTDKACQPVNLYGATKLCMEKLFQQGSAYSPAGGTKFTVVRYGNVINSRGSVLPLFKQQASRGVLRVTDERMTRFWITLDMAVDLVLDALHMGEGGEILVPELPAVRIVDLARAVAPAAKLILTGIRPGEKLDETLVGQDEARNAVKLHAHFILNPGPIVRGNPFSRPLSDGFTYNSGATGYTLDQAALARMVGTSVLGTADAQQ
jgi:UDP-N-acetylglucosamine 4,6-dehydratase